jgi:ribonuclease HI
MMENGFFCRSCQYWYRSRQEFDFHLEHSPKCFRCRYEADLLSERSVVGRGYSSRSDLLTLNSPPSPPKERFFSSSQDFVMKTSSVESIASQSSRGFDAHHRETFAPLTNSKTYDARSRSLRTAIGRPTLSTSPHKSSPPTDSPRVWKFLSGRLKNTSAVATLHSSGVLQSHSMTGGTGWWVLDGNLVIAYGAAPVMQPYSSVIGLECEALLNGLQACLRKNVRNVRVFSSSDFIVSRCRKAMTSKSAFDFSGRDADSFYPFHTIEYETRTVFNAIMKAVESFQHIQFELAPPESFYFSFKLAEKAIADYQLHMLKNFESKLCETGIPSGLDPVGSSESSTMKKYLLELTEKLTKEQMGRGNYSL